MTRTVTVGAVVVLDAGGNKITNGAAGVASTDFATVSQITGSSGIPQGGPLTQDLDADQFGITNLATLDNTGNPIQVTVNGSYFSAQADTDVNLTAGGLVVVIATGDIEFSQGGDFSIDTLATGKKFVIHDSGFASIFEVHEDGTIHIPTGGTVIADL